MAARRRGPLQGAQAAPLDLWMPGAKREALERFDRALHEAEYEYLKRYLRRVYFTVEEIAERAGVDPRVVVAALRDGVTREEYGVTARMCRRSRYGLCVQHTMEGLQRGPYSTAWKVYDAVDKHRRILRSCQARTLCLIRPEDVDMILDDLIKAPELIGVEDLDFYEKWLGVNIEEVRKAVEEWARKIGTPW